MMRLMVRLARWSDLSYGRRVFLIAVVLGGGLGIGLALGHLTGVGGVLVVGAAGAGFLIWSVINTPNHRPPWRWVHTEVQFNPANGPAACALCGFNCMGGGFWSPVPGFMNAVMHTRGCGPNLPGEEPLAAPYLKKGEGGRYEVRVD